jgi:hypothetical protein
MGDLCKGIGYVTLQKVKAKKRLLYLECSINYDAKGNTSFSFNAVVLLVTLAQETMIYFNSKTT